MKNIKENTFNYSHLIKTSTDLPIDFELKDEFKKYYEIMENTKENMFITGQAGSGKSTLLEYFRINSKKNYIILASTGIAAIKAKGKTIHSFFLFPPRILINEDIKRIYNRKILKIIKLADTILIDECSMIRSDILDGIDKSLKLNRGNKLVFGGVQLILIGDLFQLPPVVTDDESEIMEKLYPNGQYFFNANCYNKSKIKTYELTKVYRQKDQNFLNILNKIRIGKITSSDIEIINKQLINNDFKSPKEILILSPTNRKVGSINNFNLNKIKSKTFTYTATIDGNFKGEPADTELKLKVGAQVMLVKNDEGSPRNWANGTIGTISELSENNISVKIKNNIYNIPKTTWQRYEYKTFGEQIEHEVTGTFKQYPIKLAWAVTIHKSQGQTFENILIDLDTGAFAHGQTYVALSRSVCLEGIFLKRKITASDLILDKKINNFLLE